MPDEEKIVLDDISFDDVIGDGITVGDENIEPIDDVKEKEPETPASEELDDDADDKQETPTAEQDDDDDEDKDDEGDQKDTKEDDDDTAADDSIVGQILEKLGYKVEENYDDTTEGLLKLTQDVGSQMAEEQLDQLFEKFPLVKNHLQYVLDGGDSQNFMQAYNPESDYSKMDISEDDVRSQKSILADYFTEKGHDKEFINELIEDYQDSGKLHSKAQAAQTALVNVQTQKRQQLVTQQKEMKVQNAKNQEEFWNGVYDTIENSQEFAGLSVPKRDKAKFFKYLSQPVNQNGQTQRDVDHGSADMEIKLAIDYLMYNKFNLSSIINKKAKTQKAASLKDRISKNEASIKSARKASRRKSTDVDLDNLDFNF